MFYIERGSGEDWTLMMAGPHRLSLGDLHSAPVHGYATSGTYTGGQQAGDLYGSLPTPGNKTVFAGQRAPHRDCQARVRYNDQVIELYQWDEIPVNEFDPETGYMMGWKLIEQHHVVVPVEELWPLQM